MWGEFTETLTAGVAQEDYISLKTEEGKARFHEKAESGRRSVRD